MAQVITLAGERLFALKAQNNQQLDIDTFIFAYVPGQDSTVDIDRNEGLPPIGQRVHTQIVQQYGMINENAVVYSSVLDSLTGPFQFNWVGLYSAVNQTLIAIQHIPTVSKTVTEPGASGNILNRNFVIEYSGIAELTGITVDPETWQLDYTARLNGMDELTRQLAADMNGKDWFIEDGFKVVPRSTLNTFKVTAGAGYVSGLRVTLAADHILTLSSYPQFVYVDAWFDGTSESVWKGHTAFTVTNTEMDDYIDVNGRNHYVFKLARITAADTVEDLRNNNGLKEEIIQHINKEDAAHNASSIKLSSGVNLELFASERQLSINVNDKSKISELNNEQIAIIKALGSVDLSRVIFRQHGKTL
ncbi:phage tail protein [Shewanella sp. WE21]|uniref:phage tail-collar fiber domain-containing protein n=1 Tax=Shewanella sp. WE21 TaxID=2029986 RepID=UPI0020B114F0|nr:phage tail protein [Shewanella sp. WE21]